MKEEIMDEIISANEAFDLSIQSQRKIAEDLIKEEISKAIEIGETSILISDFSDGRAYYYLRSHTELQERLKSLGYTIKEKSNSDTIIISWEKDEKV
jgi:hypothetical protein